MKKKEETFWKDDFGTIKDTDTYTTDELTENIIKVK